MKPNQVSSWPKLTLRHRGHGNAVQVYGLQPRDADASEQGQRNPSIGVDGSTVTLAGRADDRHLHRVPGSKAVLIHSRETQLRQKQPDRCPKRRQSDCSIMDSPLSWKQRASPAPIGASDAGLRR